MTEELRAALSDDGDTPAGVDVGEVRARAARMRRTRWAVGGVAVLTAVAVAVPVALLRPDPAPAAPVAQQPVAQELACPAALPAPPAAQIAGDLLPATPTAGLACGYGVDDDTGPLTSVLPLTPAQVSTLAGIVAKSTAPDPAMLCTDEFVPPFALSFTTGGRVTSLRVSAAGCAEVTDGRVVRYAGAYKQQLVTLLTELTATSGCPATLDPQAALSGRSGDTLLPAGTQRLLLCRYTAGERVATSPTADAVLPAEVAVEDGAAWAARLNGSPSAAGSVCTRELGDQLLITAVTPTGTERLVAELGGCRWINDGTHQVRNEAAVAELWKVAQD
jgi:hypothetical protein